MAKIVLTQKRKKRLEKGHPWIYRSEVERIEGVAEPGDLVEAVDHLGRFLAAAYWNPQSQIIGRIVAYEPLSKMDRSFFTARFSQAWEYRRRFLAESEACRAVYGEADFVPGLIVDKYGDILVVQLLTLGMDRCRDVIVEALLEVFQPKGIYERSDVPVRELEGLEQRTGILYGECPVTVPIRENGLLLEVDIREGQKTGYFFDQRENREFLRHLMTGWGERSGIRLMEMMEDGQAELRPVNANGKTVTYPYWDGATVLECFAHTGSFSLHACKYGAKKVTCLDVSGSAIEKARRNAALNGYADRIEFVVADAFDYLRTQVKGMEARRARGDRSRKSDTSIPLTDNGRTWDVIVLDPPAFAKTKHAVRGACRGYKDINLHALKLVNEGGYLVTASCSYHISPQLFLDTVAEAAADAGKIVRLVEFRGAGKDHPRILGADEGSYLKFAVFEVRSARPEQS